MNYLAITITKLAQDYCLAIVVRMSIMSHVCNACVYISMCISKLMTVSC